MKLTIKSHLSGHISVWEGQITKGRNHTLFHSEKGPVFEIANGEGLVLLYGTRQNAFGGPDLKVPYRYNPPIPVGVTQ